MKAITSVGFALIGFIASHPHAGAAVINIPDFSFTPDGSTTVLTDTTALPTTLPSSSPEIIYVVATFNWGAGSDAHLTWQFRTSGGAGRSVLRIEDNGAVNFFPGSFNLSQDMAGTSLTVICQLDYDANYNFNGSGGRDTRQSLWFSPTAGSMEGTPDATDTWNNVGFASMNLIVDNQSTPGTAGDSGISDLVILTGADATFANALAFAGIPEPSVALLSGLGSLLLLRRRRLP